MIKGSKATEETKCRMRLAHLGQPSPMLGRQHSSDTRARMQLAHQGFQDSRETRRSKTFAQSRPDVRARISATLKHRYLDGSLSPPNKYGTGKSGYFRGVWMRSTWERNVARVFDALGLTWEYEKHRFPFGGVYIPDFYLSELDLWIEVRGWETETFKKKWSEFSIGRRVLLVDQGVYSQLVSQFSCLLGWE
jgi:hypothetical protein